jgi:hypothetical protein
LSRDDLRRIRIKERWERPVSGFWDGLDRAVFRMRGYDRHAQELGSSLRRLEDRGYIRRDVSFEDELDEDRDAFMLTPHGRSYLLRTADAPQLALVR